MEEKRLNSHQCFLAVHFSGSCSIGAATNDATAAPQPQMLELQLGSRYEKPPCGLWVLLLMLL